MLDLNKPLQTRDGREVRGVWSDGKRVRGWARTESRTGAEWFSGSWGMDGMIFTDTTSGQDLINAPVKHTRTWVENHYPEGWIVPVTLHISIAEAIAFAEANNVKPIARIMITRTITEGEGLPK